MMSMYKHGVGAVTVLQTPEFAQYTFDRLGRISSGFHGIRRGESRFYGRGLDKPRVGANSPGVLGSMFDGVMNLILDVAHVLLLAGGIYLLWRALVPS